MHIIKILIAIELLSLGRSSGSVTLLLLRQGFRTFYFGSGVRTPRVAFGAKRGAWEGERVVDTAVCHGATSRLEPIETLVVDSL